MNRELPKHKIYNYIWLSTLYFSFELSETHHSMYIHIIINMLCIKFVTPVVLTGRTLYPLNHRCLTEFKSLNVYTVHINLSFLKFTLKASAFEDMLSNSLADTRSHIVEKHTSKKRIGYTSFLVVQTCINLYEHYIKTDC